MGMRSIILEVNSIIVINMIRNIEIAVDNLHRYKMMLFNDAQRW